MVMMMVMMTVDATAPTHRSRDAARRQRGAPCWRRSKSWRFRPRRCLRSRPTRTQCSTRKGAG
eukprot:6204310-Pleurochrysis_carterae.AAC.2